LQDTDGDGVGDLPGVTRRLPDLVDLGIDTVWLSPFYRSPMIDFGYDVSDHCDVDPVFGTIHDLDELVATAHRLGVRVVLDYIPNHTSDQHPWFVEARSFRDHPRRDWYVWSDPAADGGPPTNWRSEFGGPAWTLDEGTGQYYYHAYLPEQPNLNWHHPEVRAAMLEVLRFWLARGVDGFRLDAFRRLFVDRTFPDEPENPGYRPEVDNESFAVLPVHTTEQPELFELIAELRRTIDAWGDHLLIGEVYLEPEPLAQYHLAVDEPGLHLAGNFNLLWTAWEADALAELIRRYEAALPDHAWPNWVLGNHDRSRIASRVGASGARVAAMFLLTVRGTPTIYYGDELGMTDVVIPPDLVQDPWEKNVPGRGFGRDPVRTPMPWDMSSGHGFTTGVPWLPFGPDAEVRNVAAQRDDPDSMWTLHRRLLRLRRAEPALSLGTMHDVGATDGVLHYERRWSDRRLLVALDIDGMGGPLPVSASDGVLLASTRSEREGADGPLPDRVHPGEGLVIALDGS
ncbi:MAG: alpha-amylase family glycosyl hydrolase, partial [Ilumatobacteraceae bacterium]